MSLWERFRSLLVDENDEALAAPAPAPDEGPDEPEPTAAAAPPQGPEQRLAQLAAAPETADVDEVLRLLDALSGAGRGARALALTRRVLDRHPDADRLALRVAELVSGRGDDAAAFDQLRPLLAATRPPAGALMLAGEISERRGDTTEALAFYERVLALDVDFPRARERVQRLREERENRASLAGATLMADGALARGRYRVERELGRGGAGTVFAAQDIRIGRRVALKVYHRRGRFERGRLAVEARTPARLEHPGVVRIFDLDLPLAAIAMEWVSGGSAREELRKGKVPLDKALRWFRTALEALAFVHGHGWVHRDLKPSNFLLREDGRVVLTDFGLAARAGQEAEARLEGGEGTLAYMPPEQRAGAPAHPSADVHAFGATLREVLGHLTVEPPPELLELSLACLRRDPGRRPDVTTLIRHLS